MNRDIMHIDIDPRRPKLLEDLLSGFLQLLKMQPEYIEMIGRVGVRILPW